PEVISGSIGILDTITSIRRLCPNTSLYNREVIFRAGDHGRHVYVIKSGTVEVLAERPDGSQEVIRRLGSGDHFGEMALLQKAPRSATIRTVTPVEVFKMNPSNFESK
ncbi:MAG: putative cyclic nucleotide-binding transcriptional regulator, partial [candidate division NC10 bacterium]|nr:putative cyclic nucleotide-binding transcriptional regulator [candidate division NC10 bacterium]